MTPALSGQPDRFALRPVDPRDDGAAVSPKRRPDSRLPLLLAAGVGTPEARDSAGAGAARANRADAAHGEAVPGGTQGPALRRDVHGFADVLNRLGPALCCGPGGVLPPGVARYAGRSHGRPARRVVRYGFVLYPAASCFAVQNSLFRWAFAPTSTCWGTTDLRGSKDGRTARPAPSKRRSGGPRHYAPMRCFNSATRSRATCSSVALASLRRTRSLPPNHASISRTHAMLTRVERCMRTNCRGSSLSSSSATVWSTT